MKISRRRVASTAGACVALLLLIPAMVARAAIAPQGDPVADRAMGHPDLFVGSVHLPLNELPESLAATLGADLSALGIAPGLGAYDLRAGRWGSLVAKTPLVPGPGVGNTLTWAALGQAPPASDDAYKSAVWQAFLAYITVHQAVLGISAAELDSPSIGSYENRRLVHIYASRIYGGVPVRDSFVRATLVAGNLVLYGTHNWGTIAISTTPSLSSEAAKGIVGSHLSGFAVSRWEAPRLVIVPLVAGANPEEVIGCGYAYRLSWSIGAKVGGSAGSWEALVDAQTGELLAFFDRNSYIDQKKVVGGVYPVSNDGLSPGGVPDGIEQPGYPMSRAYVFQGATQLTANSEGLVNATGNYRTSLTGPFVRIQDGCGAVNEVTNCDALDLGTSGGTDCDRPANHSFGDTHSARTGFYELNRMVDMAKSWVGAGASNNLPGVGWLNLQFPANMNINNACNAFFSPADTAAPTTGSVNFYRQGTLGSNVCRNTGEIPAVFDHEWGHGLDTYDDSKGVSLPGEFYADAASIVRLNQSCIARGFFINNTTGGFCPGNGDVCTECTGVREADWKKRYSSFPHDLAWIIDQNPTVPGNCGAQIVPPTPFNAGPCARGTHCEGSVVSEAFWDLLKRDLPCHTKGWEDPPGGPVAGGRCKGSSPDRTIDDRTALILGTRLFYLAGPGVVTGYQCDVRVGGCNADSWYMNFLAADDDDGSIENGTPHMDAISDAFRRHGLACRAPVSTNFGCAATPSPTARPAVSGAAGVRSATITWTAVADAVEYWVLRTNGVHGCDTGKTRVARIAASGPRTYTETDLLEGFTYYYSVLPVGGVAATGTVAESCAGAMSDCAAVTPLEPGSASVCEPPPNQPPVAVDDAFSVPRNHPNTINLVANDTDPDYDFLSVVSVTVPTGGGAALLNPGGSVTYTPPAGAAIGATDGFDYVISDGRGGSDTGHVSLAVGGDPCLDPAGFTVLTDPAGDETGGNASYDVRSASIAQASDGKFAFILKMTSLNSPLPPDSTWPITFAGGDGGFRFAKMATDPTDAVSFRYGNGSASGAGSPADPSSSFAADGTIRVVVPPSAIGNPLPGQTFTSFLTRIAIEVPNVGTITPDNMPNSLVPSGRYEVVTCPQ